MMQEFLLNYGVAGAMLVFFMTFFWTYYKDMRKVVENNTIALTRFYEVAHYCQRKNLNTN